MFRGISSSVRDSSSVLEDRSVLGALHEGVSRVFCFLVILHHGVVLAIVANRSLRGGVLGSGTDEAAPIGLTLLVIDGAVLV